VANPQLENGYLRIANEIQEAVVKGNLVKSTAQRSLSLIDLIERGLMPTSLPCDTPCPRDKKYGAGYLFTCESCQDRKPNPHYYSSYKKKRIPARLRWAVWERDNFTCKQCGVRRYLTIDHIVPESKGSKTEMDNLQTLCTKCNWRKGENYGQG